MLCNDDKYEKLFCIEIRLFYVKLISFRFIHHIPNKEENFTLRKITHKLQFICFMVVTTYILTIHHVK